ncbi:hypothetical protein ABPG74_006710 [Tetrahymena malaccensis]
MNYDPSTNQCTPCLINQTSCTRSLKIQQIVDCRTNLTKDVLNLGTDQNTYYKTVMGGQNNLSHLFTGIPVYFLGILGQEYKLNINFQEFNELGNNQKIYQALNEENVSIIEFEILFVPEIKDYTTNDGTQKSQANVCTFTSDVYFSLNLAKYIANIKKLSLTFKSLNPKTGLIGQDYLDFFITQFNFQGWNYFSFINMSFLPVYSIKPFVSLKNMLFDFSNNLFTSQLFFTNIQFISGFDFKKQQSLLQSSGNIFCPVIDTHNMSYISLQQVKVFNFVYATQTSLFRFNQTSANQIQTFMMKIDLSIDTCSFEQTNIIELFYNTQVLIIDQIYFFNINSLISTTFIKQIPGHNFAQSQHSIQIGSFSSNFFFQVLDAYNLFELNISYLRMKGESQQQPVQNTQSMIITNIAQISNIELECMNCGYFYTLQNSSLFKFPQQSASQYPPKIFISQLSITNFAFTKINGGIMNLVSYSNQDNLRGEVNIQKMSLERCISDGPLSYLFYFSNIKLITLKDVNALNTYNTGFIFTENSDQIYMYNGIIQQDQNAPNYSTYNGEKQLWRVLFTKNLRTRLYISNFTFQNFNTTDNVLFQFIHDLREPTLLPEMLDGDKISTFINENSQYDKFGSQTATTLVFNNCTFQNIQMYVNNINIISGLFYFQTNIRYRNLVVDVNVINVQILFAQDQQAQILKTQTALINQNSQLSSLILIRLLLSNCSTPSQIQNGVLFQGDTFVSIESNYTDLQNSLQPNDISYQGGYLNIQSVNVIISSCKFKNKISTQGGAIYIKTASQNPSILIEKSNFTNLNTTFGKSSIGLGGALSIDGTNSLNLNISSCNFKRLYSYKKGAALDVTCGFLTCQIQFEKNFITDVFAPTGIELNSLSQRLNFVSNQFTSSLNFKDILFQYNYFSQTTNSDLFDSLSRFYIIYIRGGNINVSGNLFNQVNYLQGLLYVDNAILQLNQNTLSNSNFRFTPLISLQQVQIDSFTYFNINNMNECADCNNQEFLFLQNYSMTRFNNFFLIQNLKKSLQINNINVENVVCSKCTQGIIGIVESTLQINISSSTFINNISNQGSLFLSGKASLSRILDTQQDQNVINIIGVDFKKNTAVLGGAIYNSYKNLVLTKCTINQSKANQGGGIYFITEESNPNSLILSNTIVSSNQAAIGGGLKVVGTFVQLLANSIISENQASDFGNNVNTFPVGLLVYENTLKKEYDPNLQGVLLNNWSPAVSNGQELLVYFIGNDGRKLKLESGMDATLTISLNYQDIQKVPITAKVTGITTVNYDQQLGGFYLNQTQFWQKPLSQLLVKLESSIIKIPSFDASGRLIKVNTDYKLPLIINMRHCRVGEAFIAQSGQCYLCGNQTYSLEPDSTYCFDCPKVGVQSQTTLNSLKISGLVIYTFLAILLSVKGTKDLLDSYILQQYLKIIGFLRVSARENTQTVGIVMKLFTAYIQLILVINSLNIKFPLGLNEITLNIGDPASQMGYSLDCGLHQLSRGIIPMTYFRLIWTQFMPFLYVIVFILGYFLYYKIINKQCRTEILSIAFIYIYISMQPSIVSQSIQIISCREILGVKYIKANVSEECYTSQHIKYILILLIPTLTFWVILIPAFFLKKMHSGKDKMNKIGMMYKFGFLYIEYKKSSYFWEIVKVFYKTLITFFINIYDGYSIIQGGLTIFILLVYIKIQQKCQPYLEKRLNDLDAFINSTVAVSIVIAIFISNNPFVYFIYFGYILLFTINIILILKIFKLLISGFTKKFEAKLGEKLVRYATRFPRIFKYFNLPRVSQQRIQKLWQSFRDYAKRFKKNENKQQTQVQLEQNISQDERQAFNQYQKKNEAAINQNPLESQSAIIDNINIENPPLSMRENQQGEDNQQNQNQINQLSSKKLINSSFTSEDTNVKIDKVYKQKSSKGEIEQQKQRTMHQEKSNQNDAQ